MADLIALAIPHALLALAILRLLGRSDLDENEGQDARRRAPGPGRRAVMRRPGSARDDAGQ